MPGGSPCGSVEDRTRPELHHRRRDQQQWSDQRHVQAQRQIHDRHHCQPGAQAYQRLATQIGDLPLSHRLVRIGLLGWRRLGGSGDWLFAHLVAGGLDGALEFSY